METNFQEVKIYNNSGTSFQLDVPFLTIPNNPYDQNLVGTEQQEAISYDFTDNTYQIEQLQGSPQFQNEIESGTLFIVLFNEEGDVISLEGDETNIAVRMFFPSKVAAEVFDLAIEVKAQGELLQSAIDKNTDQDAAISDLFTDVNTNSNTLAQQTQLLSVLNTKAQSAEDKSDAAAADAALANGRISVLEGVVADLEAVIAVLTAPPVALVQDEIFTGGNGFDGDNTVMRGFFFVEDSGFLSIPSNQEYIEFTTDRTVSIDFEWTKQAGFSYTYKIMKNSDILVEATTFGGVKNEIKEVLFLAGDRLSVVVETSQYYTVFNQAQFLIQDV